MNSTFLRESCLLTNEITPRMRIPCDCSVDRQNLQVDQADYCQNTRIVTVAHFVPIALKSSEIKKLNLECRARPNASRATLFFGGESWLLEATSVLLGVSIAPRQFRFVAAWRRHSVCRGRESRPSVSRLTADGGN
jgi:hypothetical protein